MAENLVYMQDQGTVVMTSSPGAVIYSQEKSALLLVDSESHQPSSIPLVTTLTKGGIVWPLNVKILTDEREMKKIDLKKAFLDQAHKCGRDGIFVFSFCGHAVKVGNEYSLKLTDFNSSNAITHITDTTFVEWLAEAPPLGCVLFILDCEFSREISSCLTDVQKSKVPLNTQFVAVGTQVGNSSSQSIATLGGNSIFQFFLNWGFLSSNFVPGNLPLTSILDKVAKCTHALSSLILNFDKSRRVLSSSTVEPTASFIHRLNVSSPAYEDEDQPDSFSGLEFLNVHFDKSKRFMNFDPKVLQWLYVISDVGNKLSPLNVLHEYRCLEEQDDVLLTAVCSIMYSIALIQFAQGNKNIKEPNMFIIAFVNTIATIRLVYRDWNTDLVETCKRAWHHYLEVVKQNKLKDEDLMQLYHSL